MISLKGVVKTYPGQAGGFTALRGVDLEIDPGRLVAVVGKSGSGKSTLLNMIGGIDRPSSGSVMVGSVDLGGLKEGPLAVWRGRSVGFVFQFFQLLPTLTILENVMLPMDFLGAVPPRRRRSRALELLSRAGVAAQAGKLPSALSGGEQQRSAIARALANDPEVLLADEPTGNLDSSTSLEISGLLRSLADEGKSVVVVTHDKDFGKRADRCVVLADGLIVSDTELGGAEEIA
jgi:putative ABC transport system ATP-binding protein